MLWLVWWLRILVSFSFDVLGGGGFGVWMDFAFWCFGFRCAFGESAVMRDLI